MDVRERERSETRPTTASRPALDPSEPEPEPRTQPSDGAPPPPGSSDEEDIAEEIVERDHPLV